MEKTLAELNFGMHWMIINLIKVILLSFSIKNVIIILVEDTTFPFHNTAIAVASNPVHVYKSTGQPKRITVGFTEWCYPTFLKCKYKRSPVMFSYKAMLAMHLGTHTFTFTKLKDQTRFCKHTVTHQTHFKFCFKELQAP